jgi:transposase
MEVMHERVSGLDVHKAMIVGRVQIMAAGGIERVCGTFETTTCGLEALLGWLTASGCTHVAMEATGVYWKPVWNILSDGAYELIVANAAHIKNVPGRKTDVNDAMWIADLVACGLVKASFVPEEAIRDLRSILRARKQLSREQTSHIQRIHAGRGQHQAGLGDQRHSWRQRPADDRFAFRSSEGIKSLSSPSSPSSASTSNYSPVPGQPKRSFRVPAPAAAQSVRSTASDRGRRRPTTQSQ